MRYENIENIYDNKQKEVEKRLKQLLNKIFIKKKGIAIQRIDKVHKFAAF